MREPKVTRKIVELQPIAEGQRNCRITVITSWQRTQQVTPAFKRLLALLLEDKERERSDEQRDATESPRRKLHR